MVDGLAQNDNRFREAAELVRQGDFAKALELYQQLPGPEAAYGAGGCLYKLGRYREAQAVLQQCTQDNPKLAPALALLQAMDNLGYLPGEAGLTGPKRQEHPDAQGHGTARPGRTPRWSTILLVVTGLSPLWSVLFLGWNPATMMTLAWIELVISNATAMFYEIVGNWRKWPPHKRFGEAFMCFLFFAIFVGISSLFASMMLAALYNETSQSVDPALVEPGDGNRGGFPGLLRDLNPNIAYVALGMAASNLVSGWRRMLREARRTIRPTHTAIRNTGASCGVLMWYLVFGAMFAEYTGYVFPVLALYVLSKTVLDVLLDRFDRRRKEQGPPSWLDTADV